MAEKIGKPTPSAAEGEMPTVVSFYMSVGQRAALLKKLRTIDKDRTGALLSALRIEAREGSR